MADYEFPEAPEIESAYRAAQRALLGIIPSERTLGGAEDDLLLTELISHFRNLLDEAELAVAERLGPLISWRGPRHDGGREPIVAGVDLDDLSEGFGEATFVDEPFEDWHGSPLERAAHAYKREAGWDFTPDDAGIWVLMLAPVSASGDAEGDRPWLYSGHLIGFVILRDRDEDGRYESVAHMWTASAWRRRGIARRLLAEARSRFPITIVERPYTSDVDAFLEAVGDPGDGE
jgi:ribosomal protein S18 acetylase RimI-like enzyme